MKTDHSEPSVSLIYSRLRPSTSRDGDLGDLDRLRTVDSTVSGNVHCHSSVEACLRCNSLFSARSRTCDFLIDQKCMCQKEYSCKSITKNISVFPQSFHIIILIFSFFLVFLFFNHKTQFMK